MASKGGRPKSLITFNYRAWRKRYFLLQTLDQHVKMLGLEFRQLGRQHPSMLVADTLRAWERKGQANREFLEMLLEIALTKREQYWLELRDLLTPVLQLASGQTGQAPAAPLPYTDEEYIEIKSKNLWHKVDPFRLTGRGKVLAITHDGPVSPPVPLPNLVQAEVSEAIKSGERVVCKANRDIEVEQVAIGQGQFFTLGVTHWTELCLTNPRFLIVVTHLANPTKSQVLEAESLPIVRHTHRF